RSQAVSLPGLPRGAALLLHLAGIHLGHLPPGCGSGGRPWVHWSGRVGLSRHMARQTRLTTRSVPFGGMKSCIRNRRFIFISLTNGEFSMCESDAFMVHQERLEIGEKCLVSGVIGVLATEAVLTLISGGIHFTWPGLILGVFGFCFVLFVGNRLY